MPYPTLPRRFLYAVDKFHSPRAQMYRTADGWQEISAHEMLRRVAALSAGLEQLGIKPGDRVGLFASNRPEWHIADLAILGLGAADVPIYFGESTERMVYILNHSGARAVFAAGTEQVRRLLQCREQLPAVEKIICVEAPPEAGASVIHYESLIADTGELELQAYRRRADDVQPEQLATIIYTSGTTGEPKGVMLTHDNFSSNVKDGFDLACPSTPNATAPSLSCRSLTFTSASPTTIFFSPAFPSPTWKTSPRCVARRSWKSGPR